MYKDGVVQVHMGITCIVSGQASCGVQIKGWWKLAISVQSDPYNNNNKNKDPEAYTHSRHH